MHSISKPLGPRFVDIIAQKCNCLSSALRLTGYTRTHARTHQMPSAHILYVYTIIYVHVYLARSIVEREIAEAIPNVNYQAGRRNAISSKCPGKNFVCIRTTTEFPKWKDRSTSETRIHTRKGFLIFRGNFQSKFEGSLSRDTSS